MLQVISSTSRREMYDRYTEAVRRNGPDCKEALSMRKEYARIDFFIDFADGVDALKRAVGGSGMEKR